MHTSSLATDWTLKHELPEGVQRERDTPLAFGRYSQALRAPDLGRLSGRFRLKEWSYTSCATDEWFFALAVVQLGYAAQLFAYVVDRKTGQRTETEQVVPLGKALTFADSSQFGVTRWRSRRYTVDAGHDGTHYLKLDIVLGTERLRGELRMEPDDALALLFPLARGRVAYTHKAAGMRARGELTWGTRRISLANGLGSLDWTRSFAARHTVWNWASFTGVTHSHKRFGLNLSARVYDDARGHSMENAVWLDGRVHTLGGVRFEVPARTIDRWRIVSLDGTGEVALEVVPWGERRARMELGLLRSVFAQPYGLASGTVYGERVEGLFGVVEDHDSLW
jgi:hypothetical protein